MPHLLAKIRHDFGCVYGRETHRHILHIDPYHYNTKSTSNTNTFLVRHSLRVTTSSQPGHRALPKVGWVPRRPRYFLTKANGGSQSCHIRVRGRVCTLYKLRTYTSPATCSSLSRLPLHSITCIWLIIYRAAAMYNRVRHFSTFFEIYTWNR